MRLISDSDKPLDALMTMRCSLPVFHVLRRDIQNAVGIDVECHFDLRHARGAEGCR